MQTQTPRRQREDVGHEEAFDDLFDTTTTGGTNNYLLDETIEVRRTFIDLRKFVSSRQEAPIRPTQADTLEATVVQLKQYKEEIAALEFEVQRRTEKGARRARSRAHNVPSGDIDGPLDSSPLHLTTFDRLFLGSDVMRAVIGPDFRWLDLNLSYLRDPLFQGLSLDAILARSFTMFDCIKHNPSESAKLLQCFFGALQGQLVEAYTVLLPSDPDSRVGLLRISHIWCSFDDEDGQRVPRYFNLMVTKHALLDTTHAALPTRLRTRQVGATNPLYILSPTDSAKIKPYINHSPPAWPNLEPPAFSPVYQDSVSPSPSSLDSSYMMPWSVFPRPLPSFVNDDRISSTSSLSRPDSYAMPASHPLELGTRTFFT